MKMTDIAKLNREDTVLVTLNGTPDGKWSKGKTECKIVGLMYDITYDAIRAAQSRHAFYTHSGQRRMAMDDRHGPMGSNAVVVEYISSGPNKFTMRSIVNPRQVTDESVTEYKQRMADAARAREEQQRAKAIVAEQREAVVEALASVGIKTENGWGTASGTVQIPASQFMKVIGLVDAVNQKAAS